MTRAALPTRRAPLALLVLLLALPALADPAAEERLARLVREANAAPVPVLAFLEGIGELGALELDGAAVQRSLDLAELPPDSPLRALLDGTERLAFDGERARLQRSHPATFSMGSGALELGERVELRLRSDGQRIVLDDIEGVKVGESGGDLYGLRRAEFLEEGGRPVAKVTAGAFVFSKTVTIDLSPPEPPTAAAQAAPGGPSPGISGALGEATGQ